MKSNFKKEFQEKLIKKAIAQGLSKEKAIELFQQAEFLTGIHTQLTNTNFKG